jgi:hypothetical protein
MSELLNVLGDAVYSTSFEEYIESIKGKEELLVMLAFSDVSKIAPALSTKDHEELLEHLIASRSLPFIPEFNVLRVHVDLPSDLIYPNLVKITVDEMNLNQILVMIKNGNFPGLRDLTIYTGGQIIFNNLPQLKKLGLYNMTGDILEMPIIPQNVMNSIEHLELSGYVLKFGGRLPKYLLMEQCHVIDSSNLPGCESLSLNSVRWVTPSYPSKYLYLEKCTYNGQPPNTLQELHLINCQVRMSLDIMKNLHTLRMLNLKQDSLLRGGYFTNLTTTVTDLTIQEVECDKVRKLSLTGREDPSDLNIRGRMPNVEHVLIHDMDLNLNEFISSMPASVTKFVASRCVLNRGGIIEGAYDITDSIPVSIMELEFYSCYSLVMFKTKRIDKLVVCGNVPKVSEGEAIPRKTLISFTEVILMTPYEFRLYCLEKSGGVFGDFGTVYDDLFYSYEWDDAWKEKVKILISYPYIIPYKEDISTAALYNLIMSGHDDTKFTVDKKTYSLQALRNGYDDYTAGRLVTNNMGSLAERFPDLKKYEDERRRN